MVRNRRVSSSPDIQIPLAPSEGFVQLFSRNQRRIYLHILKQVGSPNDAEEILQETNVVIWNKFHRFELGTNFVAWSFQIANFEVLKYRDKKRSNRLVFSGELLEVIAQESEEQEDDLDLRRAALQECLRSLRAADRELIQQRYQPGNTGEGVARQLDRPINSVYQSIGRIRKTLFECINRRLAAGAPR
jgi:RNA polymerase sigma-70 factor, ECF subfamily